MAKGKKCKYNLSDLCEQGILLAPLQQLKMSIGFYKEYKDFQQAQANTALV